MNMKNPKALLGILFVFILGAASGALVAHSIHHARFESYAKEGPAAREEQFVKRLTSRLDLDSRQQEQVRAIVHETHSGIRQLRSQIRPRIESLLEQSQGRINILLRPDQQEQFRKIIAERKARRSAERP
jgi:hypothetical protein